MSSGLSTAFIASVESIEEVGLRYALVGGLAVGAWGVSRSTRDVDLYVELPTVKRGALKRALEARQFHVPAMEHELQQFGVFRSRSAEGVFVDVFDAVGPLGEALLSRRRELHVFGRSIWVTTPEDLFVLKAFSDRTRDFEDLVSLAHVPGLSLDLAYVEDWARQLDQSVGGNDVSERVRTALARTKGKKR